MAIRSAIARASPGVAAPVTVDLEQHGRALAVGDDLPREVGADLAERGGELAVGRRRALDAARAVREQEHGVVGRALAVDGDRG